VAISGILNNWRTNAITVLKYHSGPVMLAGTSSTKLPNIQVVYQNLRRLHIVEWETHALYRRH